MSTLAAVPMGPTSPSVIPRSLKFGPSCCWSLPWLLAAERSPDTVELASQKVEMRGGTSTECAVFGGKALSSPVGPRWAESSHSSLLSVPPRRPLGTLLPRSIDRLGFGICPLYRSHLPPGGHYKVNVPCCS